jgi:NAD(P)-dependent dehydrogenase (short-subunit alcohol dehydrogenase family)
MFDLTGKVALITGARRGMGKSHAKALAAQGATVIVTDIDLNECQGVAEEIANPEKVACFKLDVSNKQEVDDVITEVVKKFGRLDILVNNAGIFESRPALDLTEEEWERTIHINLKGQFLCAQRAAKEMMKNKWGRIINVASIASGGVGIGFPGAVHYTASKGGVIGMTETLAAEWAEYGITVNCIAPGAIDTPMIHQPGTSDRDMDALFGSSIPLKRIGKSEEVSAGVVFLASLEASYTTGATLYIDGGWLAS